jgi:hypothetical protein
MVEVDIALLIKTKTFQPKPYKSMKKLFSVTVVLLVAICFIASACTEEVVTPRDTAGSVKANGAGQF